MYFSEAKIESSFNQGFIVRKGSEIVLIFSISIHVLKLKMTVI